MSITEEQLTRWAKAPSETEEGKCQNAVARITDIVKKEFGSDVRIFLQGSYKNRTNVKQDSDVDIVVLHEDIYFPDISFLAEPDQQIYWGNFRPSQYTFAEYKNDIQNILEKTFGKAEVERKNKCIKLKESSSRVNADVVPCFVHNRYSDPYTISDKGIEFVADDGNSTFSFPEQHHQNGTKKNQDTSSMFKPVVRILKNVRNDLVDRKIISPDDMSSFFLECLVWNVLPHSHFIVPRYYDATRNVLATVYNEMLDEGVADKYAEASDLKWLFRGNRTYDRAKTFMQHAWDYIGYED